jgi:hypothetical protein
MFSPYKVANWLDKIVSLYIANVPLNSGALVDLDASDTVNFGSSASLGFNNLRAGSVKLATVAPADTTHFGREFGISIPGVTSNAPDLAERILYLASSLLTVPVGASVGVLIPAPGDIIASTEFVGYLPGDSGATGQIDPTSSSNPYAPVGVFQGRFRLAQSGDAIRGRYLGNTNLNGSTVGLFQFA